ncbi:uncharacterized protein JCM6883_003855 [Sporobolomyces salmoneus]|uniref:uncharacterized protein n=1 Tax=Sporobolomyces salmoneus TaxID=183962 RepID=UPI0031815FC3
MVRRVQYDPAPALSLPSSRVFDLDKIAVSGLQDHISSPTTVVRLALSRSPDDCDIRLRFVPEENGLMRTDLAFTGDQHQQHVLRRFLGRVVAHKTRLDSELLSPLELERVLGCDLLEKLAGFSDSVIEHRDAFNAALFLQQNAGANHATDVFQVRIRKQKDRSFTAVYLLLPSKEFSGTRINALFIPLDAEAFGAAIDAGSAPSFPSATIPSTIYGTISATPPHLLHVGSETFGDVARFFKSTPAGRTALPRIAAHITSVRQFDSVLAQARINVKSKSKSKPKGRTSSTVSKKQVARSSPNEEEEPKEEEVGESSESEAEKSRKKKRGRKGGKKGGRNKPKPSASKSTTTAKPKRPMPQVAAIGDSLAKTRGRRSMTPKNYCIDRDSSSSVDDHDDDDDDDNSDSPTVAPPPLSASGSIGSPCPPIASTSQNQNSPYRPVPSNALKQQQLLPDPTASSSAASPAKPASVKSSERKRTISIESSEEEEVKAVEKKKPDGKNKKQKKDDLDSLSGDLTDYDDLNVKSKPKTKTKGRTSSTVSKKQVARSSPDPISAPLDSSAAATSKSAPEPVNDSSSASNAVGQPLERQLSDHFGAQAMQIEKRQEKSDDDFHISPVKKGERKSTVNRTRTKSVESGQGNGKGKEREKEVRKAQVEKGKKRKIAESESDADDESEEPSEAEESDDDEEKNKSKGKGVAKAGAVPKVLNKVQVDKENEKVPTPKPKAVSALARGRDRFASPFSKTPRPGTLADIIAKKGIGSHHSPGLSARAKVPSLHPNLKRPPPTRKVITEKRPVKKKKKGEYSCSDEEKPWYEAKDPEEWDSDDCARWRRRQQRIDKGLPADTESDSNSD